MLQCSQTLIKFTLAKIQKEYCLDHYRVRSYHRLIGLDLIQQIKLQAMNILIIERQLVIINMRMLHIRKSDFINKA